MAPIETLLSKSYSKEIMKCHLQWVMGALNILWLYFHGKGMVIDTNHNHHLPHQAHYCTWFTILRGVVYALVTPTKSCNP